MKKLIVTFAVLFSQIGFAQSSRYVRDHGRHSECGYQSITYAIENCGAKLDEQCQNMGYDTFDRFQTWNEDKSYTFCGQDPLIKMNHRASVDCSGRCVNVP